MTHTEAVDSIIEKVEYHGIYRADFIQQLFDAAQLPIKVGAGWKVTAKFIASVERSGGWCNIPLNTPICDGCNVASYLMSYFKLTNEESFIGNGRQFYSDVALIRAEAERRDAAGIALEAPKAKAPRKSKKASATA